MNAGDFELSDCWSSEQQPTTYYRIAAARARRLQADATTPRVKQYLDNMIAHCEALAAKVEPSVSPAAGCRQSARCALGLAATIISPSFSKVVSPTEMYEI